MNIYVKIKSIGKRKDILAPVSYTIPDETASLRQLLTAIVQKEVTDYNNKEMHVQVVPFLTQEEVYNQAQSGKVSFGTIYSEKKADTDKAIANAIQCWEDGLVRVFMNEEELKDLDSSISIPDDAVFTFIRLMRDLDLVVSVAHVGGVDPEASHSTVEMRVAIAKELVKLLKLQKVSWTGSHAKIQGTLANYSVHSQTRGRIFLPFADDDPKTAEIMSKILLLSEDYKIKDSAILSQIS